MNSKLLVIILVLAVVAAGAVAALVVLRGRDAGQPPAQSSTPAAVTPTEAAQSAPTPLPAPSASTPPPVAVASLSEEDAAKAVDQSVQEASAAVTTADQTAQDAASDGDLSAEEQAAVAQTVADAEALVASASETTAAYEEAYAAATGELTGELEAVTAELDTLNAGLDEALIYLETGQAAAQQVSAQLAAAANAGAHVQDAAAAWATGLSDLLEKRAREAAEAAPTEVAGTRLGAVSSLRDYLDSVRGALENGLTQQGISAVSQAGANAAASLEAAGGALAGLSGQVEALTTQLARGDVPGARKALPQLEQAIP